MAYHAPATTSGQEVSTVGLGGKWTLVIGPSRGVGRQITMAMARLGSIIIAHSRSV